MRCNSIENRQIRVFISSTFRDMQDERDVLMKRVFPKLRHIASMRDVAITEVDLRWGITEEEANTGKVVEICLKEIENSVPFFIGIIGNRYGWVPNKDDLGDNTISKYPDVNTYVQNQLSVTDMEMQFGVLQREEDIHAYFYIKDGSGAEDDNERLRQLRDAARNSKYPSKLYLTQEDLASKVEKDFIALLDKLYPPHPLSEEDKQELVKRSRLSSLRMNYVDNEGGEIELTEWLKEKTPVMLVKGSQGVGKSTLIANWLYNNKDLADYIVIEKFIGTQWTDMDMIRGQIAEEIASKCKIPFNGESLEEVINHVPSTLSLLIVVDDIDELTSQRKDEKNGIYRILINTPIPPNMKLLLSMSNRQDVDNWAVVDFEDIQYLKLDILPTGKRADFIRRYLSFFSKKLSDTQVESLANNTLCENTMVLRMVLDELITYGDFDNLDKKIASFLPPKEDPDSFMYQFYYINKSKEYRPIYICGVIIKELEVTYGLHVEDVLCLIGMTKYGITEDDIIQVARISKLQWSYLYCNLLPHLTTDMGKLRIKNFCFYQAVRDLYLRNMNHTDLRRRLIDLLYTRYCKSDLAELSHLCNDQCAELDYICGTEAEQIRLRKISAKIYEEGGDIWRAAHSYEQLANSLKADGQISDAILAFEKVKELYGRNPKYAEYLSYSDDNLSDCYAELGELQKALDLAIDALSQKRVFLSDTAPGIIDSLERVGSLYRKQKNYTQALNYYNDALALKRLGLGEDADDPDFSSFYEKEYRLLSILYYDMGDDDMGEKYAHMF